MNNRTAKPFIKWAGGKSQLLEQFENYYPNEIKTKEIQNYMEPFLCGGASYFYLAEKYGIKNAYLSDLNKDLILTYLVIQQKLQVSQHISELFLMTIIKLGWQKFSKQGW
jgi:site-specific DNA-adenine methylase